MIRTTTWFSKSRLPCACKGTANIILQTIQDVLIPAQLVSTAAASGCEGSCGEWKYTINYDDVYLPEGVTHLGTTDILGVLCEGALTAWVRSIIPQVLSESYFELGQVFDMLPDDPDTTYDSESLTLENPSDVHECKGFVEFSCTFQMSGTAAWEDCGFTMAGVLRDTVDTDRYVGANWAQPVPDLADPDFRGITVTGSIPFTLSAGETADFYLQFAKVAGGTEPDGTFEVRDIRILAYGVTQPV